MTVHFISGLPRAGSTLLAGLLRQNPKFTANIISPTAGLITAILQNLSMNTETSVFVDDEHRHKMVRAVFEVFHNSGRVAFDTNRSWCTRLPVLAKVYPDVKVICCVREVAWVFDSVERFTRKNALQPSTMFNHKMDGTVYTRMDRLAGPNGMIGYALDGLREACYGEHRKHLLLLKYDTLVKRPQYAMETIYTFLGEPFFAHDFDNVEMSSSTFDHYIGAPGLHTVHKKVEWVNRRPVLPPDLFKRYQGLSFWHHEKLDVLTI